jgi:uncharacterized membrane protein (Fun14 family)
MADQDSRREADLRPRRSFFDSTFLKLALLMCVVGGGLWAYAKATAPATPAVQRSAAVSGLTGETALSAPRAEPRLIDDASPATLRFGLSFVAGYAFAYFARKMIKWAVLVAGVIGVGLYFVQKSGLIQIDLSGAQQQLTAGVEYAQREVNHAKDVLLGYLPSGAAGLGGIWVGAKKK